MVCGPCELRCLRTSRALLLARTAQQASGEVQARKLTSLQLQVRVVRANKFIMMDLSSKGPLPICVLSYRGLVCVRCVRAQVRVLGMRLRLGIGTRVAATARFCTDLGAGWPANYVACARSRKAVKVGSSC